MIEGFKQIQLDGIFSKGVIQDKGRYTIPFQFSPDARNIRLLNGNTLIRKGYKTILSGAVGTTAKNVQGLGVFKNSVLLVKNGDLYASSGGIGEIDIFTNIGPVNGASKKHEFVAFNNYCLDLYGSNIPGVYDGATINYGLASMPAGAKPAFGVNFANLNIVGGTETPYTTSTSHVLYISAPITTAAPTNGYNFSSGGAEQVPMKSPILSIVTNNNQVFIFCDHGIEYLDRNTVTTLGGVATTFTQNIAYGHKPASHRSVVVANDVVFFLTKNKKIKSIGFIPGITSAQIGDISETQNQTIRVFLESLDDDQSGACGVFNEAENTVEWHVKTKGSLFNNATLVYDLTEKTFLIDNSKNYSCLVTFGNNIYAGSDLNTTVFQDNFGKDDDGYAIKWHRWIKPLAFGNQNIRKRFSEIGLVGQCNQLADINALILVDGEQEYDGGFEGDPQDTGGRGSVVMGGEMMAGEGGSNTLRDFEKVIPKSDLFVKGKEIEIKLYGENIASDVVLSSMFVSVKPLGNIILGDKID